MKKILDVGREYFHGFLSLFYPEFCVACGKNLLDQEVVLCTKCEYEMPRTHFHKVPGNPVEQSFWGRVPIERATSYIFFKKAGKYQKLVHQLKYHGREDVGLQMGRLFAVELKGVEPFASVDYLLPVPLHPKKQKKRGYNQSEVIARGMQEFLNAEIDTSVLLRTSFTETQTKKSRYERWENIEKVFEVRHPEKVEGKHVLLVDDVLTTGATLEGCAQVLKTAANVKVSLATLGYAAL
jgi:ComF family protein